RRCVRLALTGAHRTTTIRSVRTRSTDATTGNDVAISVGPGADGCSKQWARPRRTFPEETGESRRCFLARRGVDGHRPQELGVAAVPCDQLGVGAGLDHTSFVEKDDEIGPPDRV